MTLVHALASAAALGLARLDAQLLLLEALGRPGSDRGWLLAHDTDEIEPAAAQRFRSLCERRAAGEPLAYIAGHKEFFGLSLQVDPRVLVPRPDTETLVEWALETIRSRAAPRVVDLGTGSGAIALAIKQHRADAAVSAVDASAGALEVAAANVRELGLEVGLRQGSWLEGVDGRFDLVVSNPPYVAEADPHLPALRHEPLDALAAGPDGLRDIRTIVAQAPARLNAGGWLLLEHGHDQAADVRALLQAAGFGQVASRRDLAGIERCSGGTWPESG
ncbi:peptide chain release factor N(5)-glutamine methyltransferase [Ramlibacter solisilvae]|uniref:Release factor glutamine methyltransferase n=1 Tax=Ramlibacter tataouinensis TaxID=94132 RepID=A0A127JQB7_9BURK|nr:peptide chain release factor N(5)-glutamine methyltransferase [Ramlibacter tataouinensis]AMO22139.1 SAM-dependent methyltransferase [Ramlibacter tataouinensis]